jgi:hypothetical protein
VIGANKALHLTAFPLRSKAAGELVRWAAKKMNKKGHLSIRLTKQGIHLLSPLPNIDEAELFELGKQDLKKLLLHYATLWRDIVEHDVSAPLNKISLWRKSFSRASQTTHLLLKEYLRRRKYRSDAFLKECIFPSPLRLKSQPKLDYKPHQLSDLRAGYSLYWGTVFHALAAFQLSGNPRTEDISISVKAVLNLTLGMISHLFQAAKANETKLVFAHLLCGLVQLVAHTLGKPPMLNLQHRRGIFSELRPDRLSFIARRNEEAVQVYGNKGVEKALERQLALLVQSIGFFVIATKTGRNTVDLLCISPDPRSHYTFMIEAKTSRRPYALPRKDSRALQEYVQTVTKHLGTLPPLSFILVVGQAPASTLKSKMVSLQIKLGVPARYIDAVDLAAFREHFTGYLSHEVFAQAVLSGDFILSKETIIKIIETSESQQKAHSDFVQALLSLSEFKQFSPTSRIQATARSRA